MEINLILFKKDGSQKNIPLPSNVTIIGRRHDCDLRVPLKSVSRRHCQLNRDEGLLKIRDLGSRNGTILNGKPVNEAVIQAGDFFKVGPLLFALQIDGQPKSITQPNWVGQNLPPEDAATEDTIDEEFDDFEDVDELGLLEENGST